MEFERALATSSIALTGVALAVGAASSYVGESVTAPATILLVALGALVGIALVGVAVYLFVSDVRTSHTVRIAGWNLLGVAVLGFVLFLARQAPGVSLPGYVVVDVLGVSSVAHVLIGYNDVRRIRAQELARQRQKLAVVNRLARHNIRNETQVLTGYAGQLVDQLEGSQREQAREIQDRVDRLADLHDRLKEFQEALDETERREPIRLRPLVEEVLEPYRSSHGDGRFDVDVPADTVVAADNQLHTALDHLVENAVAHGSDGAPEVRVSATRTDGHVELAVHDSGPGVPESEQRVLLTDEPESQLDHASGLGLWVVKAITERYDGSLDFENDDGATVRLRLHAA